MTSPATVGAKTALRRTLLLHRQQMSEVDRAAASIQIAQMLQQRADAQAWGQVGVYLPWRGEPDLRGLWQQWHRLGRALALPVVLAPDRPLEMRHWTEHASLVPDAMGLPVPASGRVLDCDTWVIPCVGVGPSGERLGAGKGLYDRSVAPRYAGATRLAHRPRLIGVSFGHGVIDEPFADPHDLRLDAHLTERGWRSF